MSCLIFIGITVLVLPLLLAWARWRQRHPTTSSYIVSRLRTVLTLLSYLSPFQFMNDLFLRRVLNNSHNPADTETWVLLTLLLSVVSFLVVSPASPLALPLVWYGILTVYGMLFVQLRIMLVDQRPASDPRRSALLALLNYTQVVFWFALAYRCLSSLFKSQTCPPLVLARPLDSFVLSLSIMTQFGTGDVVPTTPAAWFLALSELSIGFVMGILVLAYSVSAITDAKVSNGK